jgi:hypothetical protein
MVGERLRVKTLDLFMRGRSLFDVSLSVFGSISNLISIVREYRTNSYPRSSST